MSTDTTEPPDDVCGFTLQPEAIGREYDDLANWYEDWGIATCIREPWNDHDRCIWHARIEDKPIDDLVATRRDRPEYLDGAFLVGVEQEPEEQISFDECRLRGATLTDAQLFEPDFTDADLRETNLTDAIIGNADLTDADLRGADLTDANFFGTVFTGANLCGVNLVDADLYGTNFTDADLQEVDLTDTYLPLASFTGADLRKADLTDASLRKADLTHAVLKETDLTDADLSEANLTDTVFDETTLTNTSLKGIVLADVNLSIDDVLEADFRGANLSGLNLSEIDLSRTNLTDAEFQETDLSGVDFRYTSLANVDFRDAELSNLRLNQQTEITRQPTAYVMTPEDWDATARAYHALADECSDNGLLGKARQLTIWEREARRKQARADGAYLTAINSWLSWQATGYGLSVLRVLRNMALVLLLSMVGYLLVGIQTDGYTLTITDLVTLSVPLDAVFKTLYFSAITFTTVGYGVVGPQVGAAQGIAMIEAFLGTVLIVLLGYVLGHRESI